MTATVDPPTCSVLLRLGSGDADDVAALRQQLALCLSTGITHIRVDVGHLDDLDLAALQALHGVAGYLQRRGGGLTLIGAGPAILTTVAQARLERLLPATAPPAEPHRSARSRASAPQQGLR